MSSRDERVLKRAAEATSKSVDCTSGSVSDCHSPLCNPENGWTDGWVCLLSALAVAAFIVYGSLVPFDFTRPDAFNLGAWLQQLRFTPSSRIDFLVNVAVGLPLGFFLTGVLRSGRRRSYIGAAVAMLAVVCISSMLGTAVELLQVLSPTRIGAWSDVFAQGLGASVGAVVWTLGGRAMIQWVRHLASERASGAFAVLLLQLYLPLYLIVQLTPFNVAVGAVELEAKSGAGRMALAPSTYTFDPTLLILRDVIGNAMLNVPIGALAVLGWVRRGTRRPVWRALLLGGSVVIAVGIAQDFLWWRAAGSRETIAGALGVVIGIAASTAWARLGLKNFSGRSRLIHPWLLLAAGAWIIVLVGQSWAPFDFELTPEIAKERVIRMSLVPFASYSSYATNPLQAVHEALLKFLLALPLGLLLRMAWPVTTEPRVRRFQSMVPIGATTTIVLVGIELGQMFLPIRSPDVTDVLIGAIGATAGIAIGTALARRTDGGIGS